VETAYREDEHFEMLAGWPTEVHVLNSERRPLAVLPTTTLSGHSLMLISGLLPTLMLPRSMRRLLRRRKLSARHRSLKGVYA
jgi:hypothetical protein